MIVPYLIKMTLSALLLFAVYLLFLEKESMHHFKRYYLLGSLLFSLVIYFISQEISIPIPAWSNYVPAVAFNLREGIPFDTDNTHTAVFTNNASEEASSLPITRNILFYIYIVITLFLLCRYLYNITRLLLLTRRYTTIHYQNAKLVLTGKEHATCCFLNYIFVHKDKFNNHEIGQEVLVHELAHVQQKHTFDILFMELLTIVLWFNPVIYMYKKSIKLNHEFLADEQVIKKTNDTTHYQSILLDEIKNNNRIKLASYFNYLITKKRFIMMTKKTSSTTVVWKSSISLFAMLLALCIFSVKIEAQEIAGTTTNSDETYITFESGITPEQMDKYKKITEKYHAGVEGDKVVWKTKEIAEEDWKTLYPIYMQMTQEQRKENIFIRFMGPLNPMKLRAPNKDEWNMCKSTKNKQLWLDGKEVTREDLDSYNRHNIAFFLVRNTPAGEDRIAYLWTKEGIEAYQNKYKNKISLSDLLKIQPYTVYTRTLPKYTVAKVE